MGNRVGFPVWVSPYPIAIVMFISGLQKLTLLDYPQKVACTVFAGGCNLRCPFCHNASLVIAKNKPEISEDEILGFLKKRVGILDGVCLTGGEPLAQRDVVDFMKKIRELGFCIKLDTNGCYPQRLEQVLKEGLADYVAMDIKNSLEGYPCTVGIDDFDTSGVERSVELLKSGDTDYEFRTTLVRELHSIQDIRSMGEWLKGAKRHFLQVFKDSGDIICPGLSAPTKEDVSKMQKVLSWYIDDVKVR